MLTYQLQSISAKQVGREGTHYYSGRPVQVDLLPSNVGGWRLWFRCACGRTVARLYCYDTLLRCRHCLRLKYQTQTVDAHTRACWREEKLRKLLPCGARRPKGMHRATYQRIKAAIRDAQEWQDYFLCRRVALFLGWRQ